MKRILFSGYAPVHFLCFLPVYQRLASDKGVEIWLSGGARRNVGDSEEYSIDGFYDPFPVDLDRVIPVSRAREENFDVVVCAHTSDKLFPLYAEKKVQIFHGVSFKNFAIREKTLKYDLLCLPGRYHADRYRQKGLVRNDGTDCLITGFPKADQIVTGENDRDAVLARAGLDPGRPTLLFAPTGGKNNALETAGRDVISDIRRDGRWNLLIKPHDHPKKQIDWFSELADLENDRIRLVRDLDIVPWLRVCDLLLTDASSVAVEYTLLNRPIVFIDVPKLFKNVVKRGAPLDLETYGRKIGLVAHEPSDVVAAVEQAFKPDPERQRLRAEMARHVFHAPGGASDRVASVVRYAAGLIPEIPADIERVVP